MVLPVLRCAGVDRPDGAPPPLPRALPRHAFAPLVAPFPRGGLAPWQERRAKELLLANIATDLSLAEVARQCRLSRGHFSKAFKQSTGASPHAWFTSQRVATAQALLRDTDRPLAEIALACGFGDQSHLTRVFHKRVGVSPGAWRRRLRQ
jgi:AraC family transcriptional regulator